ncbi:unnamed protein product [Amoebophrya sp. A120]|nr:unnamed protein product [Amoebophrya sp. A120]|eukprot:GSA120T00018833001.1
MTIAAQEAALKFYEEVYTTEFNPVLQESGATTSEFTSSVRYPQFARCGSYPTYATPVWEKAHDGNPAWNRQVMEAKPRDAIHQQDLMDGLVVVVASRLKTSFAAFIHLHGKDELKVNEFDLRGSANRAHDMMSHRWKARERAHLSVLKHMRHLQNSQSRRTDGQPLFHDNTFVCLYCNSQWGMFHELMMRCNLKPEPLDLPADAYMLDGPSLFKMFGDLSQHAANYYIAGYYDFETKLYHNEEAEQQQQQQRRLQMQRQETSLNLNGGGAGGPVLSPTSGTSVGTGTVSQLEVVAPLKNEAVFVNPLSSSWVVGELRKGIAGLSAASAARIGQGANKGSSSGTQYVPSVILAFANTAEYRQSYSFAISEEAEEEEGAPEFHLVSFDLHRMPTIDLHEDPKQAAFYRRAGDEVPRLDGGTAGTHWDRTEVDLIKWGIEYEPKLAQRLDQSRGTVIQNYGSDGVAVNPIKQLKYGVLKTFAQSIYGELEPSPVKGEWRRKKEKKQRETGNANWGANAEVKDWVPVRNLGGVVNPGSVEAPGGSSGSASRKETRTFMRTRSSSSSSNTSSRSSSNSASVGEQLNKVEPEVCNVEVLQLGFMRHLESRERELHAQEYPNVPYRTYSSMRSKRDLPGG